MCITSHSVVSRLYFAEVRLCDSFPIVRNGRLAIARRKDSSAQVVANYAQSSEILRQFSKIAAQIDSEIRCNLTENISDFTHIDSRNNPLPDFINPQPAQRSKSFSPIFDLSDQIYRCGRMILLLRACVTVCTAEEVLGLRPLNIEGIRSKFWSRSMCAAIDDRPATNVDAGILEDFFQVSKKISDISNETLREPYRQIYTDAVEDVDLELEESFSFFTVGSDDSNIANLFSALRNGKRFRTLGGMPATEKLLKIASISEAIDPQAKQNQQDVLNSISENDDIQVFVFEDSWHYRGIFLGHRGDKSAQFAGVAQFPHALDGSNATELLNEKSLRHQPSVRVSAQAINEIAMRL